MLMQSHCGNTDLKKCNVVNISKNSDSRTKRTPNLDSAAKVTRETSQPRHKKSFCCIVLLVFNCNIFQTYLSALTLWRVLCGHKQAESTLPEPTNGRTVKLRILIVQPEKTLMSSLLHDVNINAIGMRLLALQTK